MASSAPCVAPSTTYYTPLSHALYVFLVHNREHVNPLQQRAAAAAQALLAPGRSVSQREIQAMLEKNEAALKGWNALHKQQPAKTNPAEHKEWVRRCLMYRQQIGARLEVLASLADKQQREIQAMLEKNEAALKGWNALHKQQPVKTNPAEHKEWVRRCLMYRQQIGARLEVLASLADKQIAQEDEKSGGQRVSPNAAAARRAAISQNPAMAVPNAGAPQVQQQQPPAVSQQVYAPQQVSTMASSNPMTMATSNLMGSLPVSTASTSASMVMPNMMAPTPPMMFPEPPMPTVGFASTSSSMFFPTGQMNHMQTSSGFTSTTSMPVSGVTTSTQGYPMSSGAQTFTPNAYMASTSGPPSSSVAFMNQQNYMMGAGMMTPQQQFMPMPMPMPMNLASSGGGNMYGNTNYGMPSTAPNNANSGNGNNNSSSSNYPVDPFITPLGFGQDASFGSVGFPMTGMPNMPMHQQQMMGSMNGGNFGAQGASMMPNSFGYGGMPSSSGPNMMPQSLPTQQFQPTPQPFQQQSQLPQQTGVGSMSMSPDT
ncbi:hypothetical protein PHPALM_31589, partial [Phytophthora palmivora]